MNIYKKVSKEDYKNFKPSKISEEEFESMLCDKCFQRFQRDNAIKHSDLCADCHAALIERDSDAMKVFEERPVN